MPANKKLYLVLDSETATIPQILGMDLTTKQKTVIATTKPIIYDLGYLIVDRSGYIYKKVSYIIANTYYDTRLFETAYYKEKRSLYERAIAEGSMIVKTWKDARAELFSDMRIVDAVAAFNAGFDFKRAVPFTSYYFYNQNKQWFKNKMQKFCDDVKQTDTTQGNNSDFTVPEFVIDGEHSVPIIDIMPLAIDRLCKKKYLKFAYDNQLFTASGKYFKTSAEAIHRYLTGNPDFSEAHTALADVEIETEMLLRCLKKGKAEYSIGSFCFRMLPTVKQYEEANGLC